DDLVTHSMATSLISAGIPAVLGWDGSVGDRAATLFAEQLYRQLSNKADLAAAVGDARRSVLAAEDQGVRAAWHLARLWVGPTGGGPLVGGVRRRSRVSAIAGTKVFLDRKEHVPVAAPEMFVGRRPELQQALRALRSPDRSGALLHGQGRLGKSSLAARLADRSPQLIPAVVFGEYTAAAILDVIEQAVRTIPAARDMIAQRRGEVRERPEAFEPLLTDLLVGPLSRADEGQRALLLIIDDLEQVLLPDSQNLHRVDPEVAPVLAAVLRAFEPAETDSRLLLTSRYQFTLDGLQHRLEQVHLRPLSLVARLKLLNRQQAQARPGLQTERSALAVRAAEVSRGNPGLQDLIGLRLVFSDQVDTDRATAAITDMEAYLSQGDLPAEAQVRQFLEDLALDTLLDLAGPEHRALLRDLTLFDLPVPEPVVAAVAQHSGGSAARLRGLGLLDTFPDPYQPQRTAVAVNTLAAGRITPLNDDEIATLTKLAVAPLFAAWGGSDGRRAYSMDLELTRLALPAENPEVTAACAAGAVQALTAGPAATAFQLGQSAIALLDEHHHAVPLSLLRQAAEAARISGDGENALHLFNRASSHTGDHPPEGPLELARVAAQYADYLIQRGDFDHAEQLLNQAHQTFADGGAADEAAACQGSLADILFRRGEFDEALRIRREVELPVYERLGDARSVALTWSKVADVLFRRGEFDEALRIRREVELPVYERLGDARSVAVAWGKVADVLFRRGEFDEALRIRRDVQLPVYERLGDARSVAVAWGKIADVLFQRGEFDEALRIRRDVQLPVYERLGDTREVALTWGRVADFLSRRGDHAEAVDLYTKALHASEALKDVDGIAAVKWGLAQIELARQDYAAALPLLDDSFRILQQLQRLDGIAVVGNHLGQILMAAGSREKAIAVFEMSIFAAKKIGDTELSAYIEDLLARAAFSE
ncbi:tetratricopeptide repeat protein, partial [Actinoplanes subglobosus]